MKCKRCGNEMTEMFYHGSHGWYCRECIGFGLSEERQNDLKEVDSEYTLSFQLTAQQKIISEKLLEYAMSGKSVLLEAVCGAGKTELVYQTIAWALASGQTVGFAVPRRQVVLELAQRMKETFTKIKVTPVCQGFTSDTTGDLIICTTHQLYRYYHYFDYLILDEPDAFPFKGNRVLQGLVENSYKKVIIYLSATPDAGLISKVKSGQLEYLYLAKRPTGKELTVPKVYYRTDFLQIIELVRQIIRLRRTKRPLLLFVPTIQTGSVLKAMLKLKYRTCFISSLTKNKDMLIRDFRNGRFEICIATTVLERGVTIPHVNVIVLDAGHPVYDQASLIQISGRVGRSVKDPYGECIFISTSRSETIDGCLERIQKANHDKAMLFNLP